MKKYFKNLFLLILIMLIFPNNIFALAQNPIRLGGENRISTSIEISKSVYNKAETVILIEYNSQLDGLLSTVLAKKEDAPILLSLKDKVSISLKEEIERLGAENIILVSEEGVFDDRLKEDLLDFNVREITGSNVEETAIKIIEEVYGEEKDEVFLTLGYGVFADALSVGGISAIKDIPILLTNTDKISETTILALKNLNIQKVNILGGKIAISETVEKQLQSLGIALERIDGANREETAINISKKYNPTPENIIIANGYNYADAVTGGYMAFKKNAGILLTRENSIDLATLALIDKGSENIYILGGEKAVSEGVEKDLWYIANDYILREEKKDIELPFKTISKNDPTLEKGLTRVQTEGRNGIKSILHRVVEKDNKEIERKILREYIVKQPQNQIVLVGTKVVSKVSKENLYFIRRDVHLKEKTSNNSNTLITIPKGSHLDYISTTSSWHKINYKGKTGYVDSRLIGVGWGYKAGGTLIVNKGFNLSSNFNPGVNPEALSAVNLMKKDAKRQGITLNVFSDFRTYSYQINLYNRYVKKDGKKLADRYSARPGYSEHQTGLTFDIGGANSKYYVSQKLGSMKEGIWMAENSYKYGLILRYPKGKENITGYSYEPWHFRYVGVDLAKKIKKSGLTLDEYLGVVQANY